MIVIVIIGVVYTLAVVQLQNVKDEKFVPSFLNLKEYLSSFIEGDAKSARLLCLDDCSECGIYVDGEKVTTIESFFDESVTLYRYDFLLGTLEVQDAVYFNEEEVQENVCFSFEMYKNNVSEQLFVAYDDKVYDFTSYFEKTLVYDSLEELIEKKEQTVQEVMQ
jgi:hypothetical protein